MANKHRFATRSASNYGTDLANIFFAASKLENQYVSTLRNGSAGAGMALHHAYVEPGAGAFGIGAQLLDAKWLAAQVDDAGVETDKTAGAKGGLGGIALESLTDDAGHIVSVTERFSALVYTISTAAVAGDTYTQAWSYWGTLGWVTMLPLSATTDLFTDLGRNEVVFLLPPDATKVGGYYRVRYQATAAPSTAAVASRIYVSDPCRIMGYPGPGVIPNATLVFGQDGGLPVCGDGESLVVYTSAPAATKAAVVGVDIGASAQLGQMEGRT
jgi:hypothetical protein